MSSGRDGMAEIPALSGVIADAEQAPGLRGGLDADCGDVKGHGVRKLHQSRDDLEVEGIFPSTVQALHERPHDLQFVYRKDFQVARAAGYRFSVSMAM